jgi:hypothetical protein
MTRSFHRFFVGKSHGEQPLGRPKSRWMNNVKVGVREINLNGGRWMIVAGGLWCLRC